MSKPSSQLATAPADHSAIGTVLATATSSVSQAGSLKRRTITFLMSASQWSVVSICKLLALRYMVAMTARRQRECVGIHHGRRQRREQTAKTHPGLSTSPLCSIFRASVMHRCVSCFNLTLLIQNRMGWLLRLRFDTRMALLMTAPFDVASSPCPRGDSKSVVFHIPISIFSIGMSWRSAPPLLRSSAGR